MEGQNCISPSAAGRHEEVHPPYGRRFGPRGQSGCGIPCPSRPVRGGRYHPGALELAKIPYVGCGVLSSAVSMDKLYTKIIVDDLGVRQAAYEAVYREQLGHMESVVERVEKHFPIPYLLSRPMQAPPGA